MSLNKNIEKEMIASAFFKEVICTPSKMKIVADLIKGKKAKEASLILNFVYKKAARIWGKLLKSAIANANLKEMGEALDIKEIRIGRGTILKRFMPRGRGRSSKIEKVRSNIGIILEKTKEKNIPKVEKEEAKDITEKTESKKETKLESKKEKEKMKKGGKK